MDAGVVAVAVNDWNIIRHMQSYKRVKFPGFDWNGQGSPLHLLPSLAHFFPNFFFLCVCVCVHAHVRAYVHACVQTNLHLDFFFFIACHIKLMILQVFQKPTPPVATSGFKFTSQAEYLPSRLLLQNSTGRCLQTCPERPFWKDGWEFSS